ncbi:MAG: DUF523 domain-containing protein [Proteobacteria bacterium]|nr:DUF523 domain-containing protein [Pseudomonadota bacterium]
MNLNVDKIKIGISPCLLGENVRYDGGHRHDHYITDILGRFFQWVSICPEVGYGLPVPREAMNLVGDPLSPRLVTVRTGIDHTEGMKKWAEERLNKLAQEGICGFIFKSRSPSSGLQGVKVFTEKGNVDGKGVGIFAAAFIKKFPLVPVVDDDSLKDKSLRESFIERVFVLSGWQEFLQKGSSRFLYPPTS